MDWDRGAQIFERVSAALCLLVVAGSAAYFSWDAHRTQIVARLAIASTGALTDRGAATLDIVNRPCGAKDTTGKLLPCGTLAELDKAAVKVQDIAVTTQRQVEQSSILIDSTAATLSTVGGSVQRTSDKLTETAAAATGALGALQDDLTRLQQPISATTGLLAQGTVTVNDADILLKQVGPNVQGTLTGLNGIAGNLDATTASVARMTEHLEKTVDAPKSVWVRLIPAGELGAKIYLCITQHICTE